MIKILLVSIIIIIIVIIIIIILKHIANAQTKLNEMTSKHQKSFKSPKSSIKILNINHFINDEK